MNIEQLRQQLEGDLPPIERWQPKFCGDFPITIKKDGTWHYMGSAIKRDKLVELFASVLIFEDDQYFLKTPVEKVRIQVEDAPFLIVEWSTQTLDNQDVICLTDNIGRQFVLGDTHPMRLINQIPYIRLHFGCLARVHRNVYYQWAELAHPDGHHHYIYSGKTRFLLG